MSAAVFAGLRINKSSAAPLDRAMVESRVADRYPVDKSITDETSGRMTVRSESIQRSTGRLNDVIGQCRRVNGTICSGVSLTGLSISRISSLTMTYNNTVRNLFYRVDRGKTG